MHTRACTGTHLEVEATRRVEPELALLAVVVGGDDLVHAPVDAVHLADLLGLLEVLLGDHLNRGLHLVVHNELEHKRQAGRDLQGGEKSDAEVGV